MQALVENGTAMTEARKSLLAGLPSTRGDAPVQRRVVYVTAPTFAERRQLVDLVARVDPRVSATLARESRDVDMVVAQRLSRSELELLKGDAPPRLTAWLLLDCDEVDVGDRAAWVYRGSATMSEHRLGALVASAMGLGAKIAQPPPPTVLDPETLRDVLDAVRDFSALLDPVAAARSLRRSALALTGADGAWCWFYDADSGALYDGTDADAPQFPGDRGVVALAARSHLPVCAAVAHEHEAYGGALDAAHFPADHQLQCEPVVAPDGVCHAVLAVVWGPRRDLSTAREVAALSALARHVGAPTGQLALRGQLEMLEGEPDGPFRPEAVRARDESVDDGAVVRVVPAWVDRAYLVLSAFFVAALVFVCVGRVHQYAAGTAVIRATNRFGVAANVAGTVEKLNVHTGDRVAEGQLLATLYDRRESAQVAELDQQWETELRQYLLDPTSELVRQSLASLRAQRRTARAALEERQIRAPRPGVVGEIHTRVGAALAPGELVASILDPNPRFNMVAFIPASDAPQLKVGMPLRLEIVGYPYAYLHLKVGSASREAAGQAAVAKHLGPELADTVGPQAATVVVESEIDRDYFEVDGVRYPFREGMPARAEVRIRSEPIAFALLPWLRRLRGGLK